MTRPNPYPALLLVLLLAIVVAYMMIASSQPGDGHPQPTATHEPVKYEGVRG